MSDLKKCLICKWEHKCEIERYKREIRRCQNLVWFLTLVNIAIIFVNLIKIFS